MSRQGAHSGTLVLRTPTSVLRNAVRLRLATWATLPPRRLARQNRSIAHFNLYLVQLPSDPFCDSSWGIFPGWPPYFPDWPSGPPGETPGRQGPTSYPAESTLRPCVQPSRVSRPARHCGGSPSTRQTITSRCLDQGASLSPMSRHTANGRAGRVSGWPDLNRRPLDPQSSALTKLRHSP